MVRARLFVPCSTTELLTRGSSLPDYLQFTITSRCEMPNAEFAEEINKAADELYELFASSGRLSNEVNVYARL